MRILRYILILTLINLSNLTLAQVNKAEIQWVDLNDLSDSLAVQPKKIILFIHTDWCGYCNKMLKESFTDPKVISKINQDYYAVHFDAESTQEIIFDNTLYKSGEQAKRRGKYHPFVTLLFQQKKLIFPTTMVFDNQFELIKIQQNYLSASRLLKILYF